MNTTYFLNQIMGNVFGTKKSPSLPTEYWIGLSSTTPELSGTGVAEPSGTDTGYARKAIVASLSEPEDGVIKNTSSIAFNESTADWGKMTHYVIFDSETEGNLLFFGELKHPRTVEVDTSIVIKTGELVITLENKQ